MLQAGEKQIYTNPQSRSLTTWLLLYKLSRRLTRSYLYNT